MSPDAWVAIGLLALSCAVLVAGLAIRRVREAWRTSVGLWWTGGPS